jgi:hypothetical protein
MPPSIAPGFFATRRMNLEDVISAAEPNEAAPTGSRGLEKGTHLRALRLHSWTAYVHFCRGKVRFCRSWRAGRVCRAGVALEADEWALELPRHLGRIRRGVGTSRA